MTNLWICKHSRFETECAADSRASSTPGSENYGNHMTAEEVVDFFAPQPSTTNAVTEWLVASGIGADRFAISANKQVLPSPGFLGNFLDRPLHAMNANMPCLSGFNLMQQPPKLKSCSSPSSSSGSTSLGLMIFRAKSIISQLISKSILTT
jgi:hypothetical protein